ncbi:MAG: AmmeMemoRadiSam system protein B [Bacteroidota bacterium]|nr:AmmeMemoRadiSam system protein B [Bacteroidota bacterium]
MKYNKLAFIIPLMLILTGCQGQTTSENKNIRKAQFTDQFYPAGKTELTNQLKRYFSKTHTQHKKNIRALVVPHAGYVFSGSVAATAYQQIDKHRNINTIFILAPAHRVRIEHASVFTGDAYETPLGKVLVNTDIANKLTESTLFSYNEEAHAQEHSIEVQLPFLQYHLKNDFKIVPILINTNDRSQLRSIADTLKSYYTEDNLFVVSTDFSHYPAYNDACYVDSLTAQAISTGNPDKLYEQVRKNASAGITNLQTSLCGYSPMMVMLHLVESKGHTVELLEYKNSSQSKYGDKNRVVGYWAMQITENKNHSKNTDDPETYNLNHDEKKILLELARYTLEERLKTGMLPEIKPDTFPSKLQKKLGCFVTLNKNGKLRGCIGNFKSNDPLINTVQQMAISAALYDNRFKAVTYNELDEIDIEISVLTPLKPIESIDEFELGKHGIYIKKGRYSGTYLPQVAEGRDWTKEEFISHCSQYKAGIGPEGWEKAELFTYEALVFSEHEILNDDEK